jgi:polar amino acid transport system substrate-binding protein
MWPRPKNGFSYALLALIAASGATFLAALSAAARPLDEVVAAKSLRVVAYLDNAPFSWDDHGTVRGIDADIARAIAHELGVTCELILRMQGENADDDLRANVWRGPLTGGGVGDLMMHVPIDREFTLRNREAVIGGPYFQERIALAIHPEITGKNPSFDVFKTQKIGVQLATVSDYFLMSYEDGALIDNVVHHVKPRDGASQFKTKAISALMGVRSNIEALLHDAGVRPVLIEPPMDGIVRTQWTVGMAWKENSRDLGYAIEGALEKLKERGEIKRIFARYGVTYIAPPISDRRNAGN